MDAAFLYAETPNAPLNLLGVLLLDGRNLEPGTAAPRICEQIEGRLSRLPILRCKIARIPLGLDHPVWVEDRDFDLRDHVCRTSLKPRGSDAELWRLVERFAVTPLRRDRPLWQIHVVEGLDAGRVALVARIQHAAADGVTGTAILSALLDADDAPGDRAPAYPAPLAPSPAPSAPRLLAGAACTLALRPWRTTRQLTRGATAAARWGLAAMGGPRSSLGAPRTRLNGPVSGRRKAATGSVALDEVKRVKNALGGTVNHVVLAACAGSLRRYLAGAGDLPDRPLVAAVPRALARSTQDAAGNSLSVLFVDLPVHIADPIERLRAARIASDRALVADTAAGPQLGDWAELALPALVERASQLYHRWELASMHAPLHNVVISNVPGPAEPLHCAGARVASCHPFGPIYDGWGLNLTVMSYAGSIGIGAMACADRVPDVERIPLGFEASVDELARAASGRATRRAS